MKAAEWVWLLIGLTGQALFSARFFIQWVTSERLRTSVLPLSFWYFSVFGGAILLAYAIHQRDPVFILGQITGLAIYLRNLYLIYNPPPLQEESPTS